MISFSFLYCVHLINHSMKKGLAFLIFVIALVFSVNAQNAQVTFSSATNFALLEDGFHPVKFRLTDDSNANLSGLLEYVQNNPAHFKLEIVGSELALQFAQGIHWGVWMKVFGSMDVSQIEIQEGDRISVVDPMGFLQYFHLINQ